MESKFCEKANRALRATQKDRTAKSAKIAKKVPSRKDIGTTRACGSGQVCEPRRRAQPCGYGTVSKAVLSNKKARCSAKYDGERDCMSRTYVL